MIDFMHLDKLKGALADSIVITDSNVYRLYNKYLPDDSIVLDAELGEELKSLNVVEKLTGILLKRGANRLSRLAAVGGGVIGDLVGFVASVYMRGIDWVCVPTTVTAFADSSIGGKTAVNCGMKNAIGRVHDPKKIFFCTDFLRTLSQEETLNGMAEVYKTALIDKKLYAYLNKNISPKTEEMHDILSRCATTKQKIVDGDPHEKGKRLWLNIGHTVGHAIEYSQGISHGKAVALGMLIEAHMADVDAEVLTFIKRFCALYQNINTYSLDPSRITQLAKNDKKNQGGITLFLPKSIGKATAIAMTEQEFHSKIASALKILGA